jgi:UDP-N-acetylmuramoyl-tripeptide--D-alanyl-D-alanine ligase
MKLHLHKAAEFMAAKGSFDGEALAAGYSIDSRTIQPGELFFALIGERLNGHDYVEAALQGGAVAAVVSDAARFADKSKLLVVEDTTRALQTLGSMVRCVWGKQVIAITGSAGKTTTKEITAHLLAQKFRVFKSEGNLNNHFGLPLQLLKLEPEQEIAVTEMGMNHAGEITQLAGIGKPNAGVVTCVAPVHLEFFDSIAGIARAKYELVQALPAGGTAVLNADDPYVSQFGRDFNGTAIYFGIDHPADVCAQNLVLEGEAGSRFKLVIDGSNEDVQLPLVGRHNVMNALAAAAVASHYGVSPSQIASALRTLKPADKRGEIFTLPGVGATIINDCYNSNPAALKAMVDSLQSMKGKRRVVVAGEMLELGPTGAKLHEECGEYMAGKADRVIGVRGLAQNLIDGAKRAGLNADFVASPEEAAEVLAKDVREGDVVLFKASRGVKLERAVEALKSKLKVNA